MRLYVGTDACRSFFNSGIDFGMILICGFTDFALFAISTLKSVDV
jgi:hypothetical protein